MTIAIRNPCEERWEAMEPRGEGRWCERCDRTVVYLSDLTEAQAEARLARARGRTCIALRMDARTHTPIFRPEPSVAPRWAGGVVLAAALAGGCSTTTTDPASRAELRTSATATPDETTPPNATPMTPTDTRSDADAHAATRALAPDELELPAETGEPTPEQRQLTALKRRQSASHPAPSQPAAPSHPTSYIVSGW